jgi:nucleoside triphosphate diphosphatase
MAMLRNEQYGCPWDRKQNFQSITAHTLEEVYEVIDAIESLDYDHLKNELGDLLFQIVFYAQLGKEQALFDLDDIITEISQKLLTRHPHVFPEATIESFGSKCTLNSDQIEANWESIKIQEKRNKLNLVDNPDSNNAQKSTLSILDDIPQALPALIRAQKLQKRVAINGFDWVELDSVISKLKEEIAELEEAIEEENVEHIQEELGDVLFSCVNISRHLKLEAEISLRLANNKFERRFRQLELLLANDNKNIDKLDIEKLEQYWQKVKELETNNIK